MSVGSHDYWGAREDDHPLLRGASLVSGVNF